MQSKENTNQKEIKKFIALSSEAAEDLNKKINALQESIKKLSFAATDFVIAANQFHKASLEISKILTTKQTQLYYINKHGCAKIIKTKDSLICGVDGNKCDDNRGQWCFR